METTSYSTVEAQRYREQLLTQFACAALTGFLAGCQKDHSHEEFAQWAFNQASAMLAEHDRVMNEKQ